MRTHTDRNDMTTTWPPRPTQDAPWFTRRFRILPTRRRGHRGRGRGGEDVQELTVREVMLWGQQVLLNEAQDAVWCRGCGDFVLLDELTALPYTGHQCDGRRRRGVWRLSDEGEAATS